MWAFFIKPSSLLEYILSYIWFHEKKDVLIMHKDEALRKFEYMREYGNLSKNTIHMRSWYLSNFLFLFS